MHRSIPTIATTLLIAAGAAFAATESDRTSPARNSRQVKSDKAASRNDLRDLARLETLAGQFDTYRADGDMTPLRGVCQSLHEAALVEISQSRKELSRSRKETASKRGEASFSRREIAAASVSERPAGSSDPVRDSRDSQAGSREAVRRVSPGERRAEIATAIRNVKMGTDPASLDHQRRMLGELIDIARAESASDTAALRGNPRGATEPARKN